MVSFEGFTVKMHKKDDLIEFDLFMKWRLSINSRCGKQPRLPDCGMVWLYQAVLK
jgi:hypothetical protein